jgi:hypothetical protein
VERGSLTRSSRSGLFEAFLLALYAVAFGAVLWLLSQGFSFYTAPIPERAHHDGYWTWKAGGSRGHPLGIAGAAMMALMLLYSVRKRLSAMAGLGSLSRWLDLHIFLGIVGPLLIVLHSTFKVRGLVALSFWSMVVVATSGILGRYLYLQIPRTRAGEELNLAEAERLDALLTERLRDQFHLDAPAIARLEALAAGPPPRGGLLVTLGRIALHDLSASGRLGAFARGFRGVPHPVFREFERVVRQKAQLRRRLVLWTRLHDLFHYWHVVHKPFAVVMYLFLCVHVVVAVMTGYAWGGP